jgi:hypothetical protein
LFLSYDFFKFIQPRGQSQVSKKEIDLIAISKCGRTDSMKAVRIQIDSYQNVRKNK